jgi:hypothetical protein
MKDEERKLAEDLRDVVGSIGDMVDVTPEGALTEISAHIIASALHRRGWEAESEGGAVYARAARESEYQPDTRRRYKVSLQQPRSGHDCAVLIEPVPELGDVDITVTVGPD